LFLQSNSTQLSIDHSNRSRCRNRRSPSPKYATERECAQLAGIKAVTRTIAQSKMGSKTGAITRSLPCCIRKAIFFLREMTSH
ncbi:hypothetical protein RCH10_005426, partial [Variovorax sp. GrIS 2.14]|uniref:hypothetical protein n=1 Tax=Variovorax sp. GrIS 2.14 TaxID=3071709 RepID=UPI0038F6CC9C